VEIPDKRGQKTPPRTVFLAETLGCTLEQIAEMKGTGFDYLYNSRNTGSSTSPGA